MIVSNREVWRPTVKNGKLNTKNIMAMAAVGAVAVGGVSFLGISTADEASVLQCGYSTRMEDYTSLLRVQG